MGMIVWFFVVIFEITLADCLPRHWFLSSPAGVGLGLLISFPVTLVLRHWWRSTCYWDAMKYCFFVYGLGAVGLLLSFAVMIGSMQLDVSLLGTSEGPFGLVIGLPAFGLFFLSFFLMQCSYQLSEGDAKELYDLCRFLFSR